MSEAAVPEPDTLLGGELALYRLLVAIDGSAKAELALTAAVTAGRRDNATITLITVRLDLAASPGTWSVPIARTFDQAELDADARKRLDATIARIPADISVHTVRQGRAPAAPGPCGDRRASERRPSRSDPRRPVSREPA